MAKKLVIKFMVRVMVTLKVMVKFIKLVRSTKFMQLDVEAIQTNAPFLQDQRVR